MAIFDLAIGDIHPTAILTDQCESIKSVVREVMPNTIHKYCLWHILCKVPEKFKHVREYNKVVTELRSLIYDSLTIEMFE